MSDGVLFRRVLLWHKLIAQVTGGIALTSSKRALNREQATEWSTSLRNVADEIDAVLAGKSFILDERGQRMVGSAPGAGTPVSVAESGAASRKAGGLRTATRKKA